MKEGGQEKPEWKEGDCWRGCVDRVCGERLPRETRVEFCYELLVLVPLPTPTQPHSFLVMGLEPKASFI